MLDTLFRGVLASFLSSAIDRHNEKKRRLRQEEHWQETDQTAHQMHELTADELIRARKLGRSEVPVVYPDRETTAVKKESHHGSSSTFAGELKRQQVGWSLFREGRRSGQCRLCYERFTISRKHPAYWSLWNHLVSAHAYDEQVAQTTAEEWQREHASIFGRFQMLRPRIRYPLIALPTLVMLFPALSICLGVLRGMEFTLSYSSRLAYCSARMEVGLVTGSRLPKACHDGDDEKVAYQTLRGMFAAENEHDEADK